MQKSLTETGLACAAVFTLSVFILPGFTLAGLASAAPRSVPPRPVAARGQAPRTVVLPLSQGPYLLGAKATSYWIPQAADLRRLEADTPRSVANYYRQYIGIVKDGKHLIYISGFSAAVASEYARSKFDWRRHAVFVMDGGTGFFEATYDPKTRKFSGPEFHGLG